MTIDQFNNVSWKQGMKVIYRGGEAVVVSVYLWEYIIRISNEKYDLEVSCKDIDLIPSPETNTQY